MPDPLDDHRVDELRDAAENASFNSARRHVGAAGFVQRDSLEQIISAGREQIHVTRSLRQVVTATQAQLRTLKATGGEQVSQSHLDTLQGIVASSEAQIRTATELREAIQRTLTDVRGTPLEEISASLLNTLGEVIRRQMQQLQAIIATALSEADTVGQRAELRQVSLDAQTRQTQVEHEQAERDLIQLEALGTEALERVRELEEGGQTHASQRTELERKAEQTRQRISALEQEQEQNLAELTRLEQAETASTEVQKTLEAQVKHSQEQLNSQAGEAQN